MATNDNCSKDWPRGQPPYMPPSNDGVTRVVHMKRFKGEIIQDCDVYIGRQNNMGGWKLPQSKWANPFKMKDYKNNRRKIIDDYRDHVMARPHLLESLHELKGKRLGCWCKPEECHGDVLLELVNKFCTEDGDQTSVNSDALESTDTKMFDLQEDFPSLGSGPNPKTKTWEEKARTVAPKDGASDCETHNQDQQPEASENWPSGHLPYVPPSQDGVTRVVHLKRYNRREVQDCDVYIGRENRKGGWDLPRSKWANPFTKHKYPDKETRIQMYRDHITSQPQLMQSLHELKGKRLGCWCKPEECHGDILIELVHKFCSDDDKTTCAVKHEQQVSLTNDKQISTNLQEVNLDHMSLAGATNNEAVHGKDAQVEANYKKSRRKQLRTPHLYTKGVRTPKWHPPP